MRNLVFLFIVLLGWMGLGWPSPVRINEPELDREGQFGRKHSNSILLWVQGAEFPMYSLSIGHHSSNSKVLSRFKCSFKYLELNCQSIFFALNGVNDG